MTPSETCMRVSTTNGENLCQSKAEITELIKRGATLPDGDELWISSEETEYPCLAILAKGGYACVHYFQNEDGEVWQSCGDCDEEVTFLAGGEAWTAPEYVIIPLEKVIYCMEEFWNTQERPASIEWEALWEEG